MEDSSSSTMQPCLVVNLHNTHDILQQLRKEFADALLIYHNSVQQVLLDPENPKLRQSFDEAQKQIVGASIKQRILVRQLQQTSQVTPSDMLSDNKVPVSEGADVGIGIQSNGTSDGGSHHCTPPNSEDEHSDLSRSLSSGSGISICTESISCPSSVSNTPLSSRPNSPSSSNSKSSPPIFPSEIMEQEEFLKGFNLITHESLKTKSETKRVERRRRTTANPKYNGHGFVDITQPRRVRRTEDPEGGGNSPKRMKFISGVKCKISQPRCIICEQVGCNLTCENCESQLHVDCIRVSGSKAPAPTRLHQCPKCIATFHESRRLLGSNSSTDESKFQKPLISTTPIIPFNLKRKALDSVPPDRQITPSETKPTIAKPAKVAKKTIATGIPVKFKTVTAKSTGSLGKTVVSGKTPVPKKGSSGVKVAVTESAGTLCKVDLIGKPVLTSPFKTLSALTSKGAATNAASKTFQSKFGGNTFSIPNVGDSLNGNPSLKQVQPIKKKSKINGVKAKTLSMTGNLSNSPNNPQKTFKPKTSPLNNLNSNGNISNPKPKVNIKSSSRLPKLNTDQQLSMQRTIIAMTAAAKSVMSSNGLRVLPVTLGSEVKVTSSEQDPTPFTTKKANSDIGSPPPTLVPSINIPVIASNIPNDSCSSPRMNSLNIPTLTSNPLAVPSTFIGFKLNEAVNDKQ